MHPRPRHLAPGPTPAVIVADTPALPSPAPAPPLVRTRRRGARTAARALFPPASIPGLTSLNVLQETALGGGSIASLRIDTKGKAFAQQLLDMPVKVSNEIAKTLTENE